MPFTIVTELIRARDRIRRAALKLWRLYRRAHGQSLDGAGGRYADVSVGDVWPEGSAKSRDLEDIDLTRAAGQQWLESGRSCVLRVPSIVVKEEHNLVVNPLHAEAQQIALTIERPFTFDGRLL